MVGQRIFVSGAGGFIGSHLVDHLVRAGHDVCGLVHYNSHGSIGWLANLEPKILSSIKVIKGDVCDLGMMITASKGYDVIVNMAALIGIPYSYAAPSSYINVNAMGTCNLLQAAQINNADRFIQTSTSEVYGTAQYVPMDEKHPLRAQSPYAASKIAADQLALSFQSSFGLPATIIRPFNTFGPRQSLRAVIPTILSQLSNGAPQLRLGNLETKRDFTFVTDTAAGIAAAVTCKKDIAGEVINLGSGVEFSIGTIVKNALEIFSSEAEIITEKERVRPNDSEVMRLLSDNQKAKRLLGWAPEYCSEINLRHALELTAKWFQQEENLNYYTDTQYAI